MISKPFVNSDHACTWSLPCIFSVKLIKYSCGRTRKGTLSSSLWRMIECSKPHRGGLVVSTRGGAALLVQARDRLTSSAKLLVPHVATRIWVYGPFEYLREYPSVGCTSHPGVRSVSLIDPDLTIFSSKKKRKRH